MAVTRDTAVDTLQMLHERLARIDFAVNGDDIAQEDHKPNASAKARLASLERTLNTLAASSLGVSDVLQLHNSHPELFHPADPKDVPTTLPPASLAQLILAHDHLYRTTSTQLSTLNNNKEVPDASALTKLISLQPRIDKIEARQAQQANEFAELRTRSAKIVERWYENGVLDMGERWAGWEEKLKDCEILVRRKEAAKKREEEML
ncbi:hypothetical protein M409DRAFT_57921 [Zasmidium cellare ATCC 36951]|uniref:Nuclear distribution protein RO10 n=1 Tax=Zasmidium cellare ATCC 36951 TaxID=1080233 RepID=A0A6A6CBL4_ZASCE|nr:uncharacterized protein M409DRAFT_57921 [Zasmidium cellare ATCC 36951]KAF2162866.1 hypothetical protein M409DRAFT_57921 [Zasmidium cellare ATCC 36951]